MTAHAYRHHVIAVPLENGDTCVIEIDEDTRSDRFAFKVAGTLLDQSPEAIHAVIGQALMRLREVRDTGQEIRDRA